MNENLEDYSSHQQDFDDHSLYETNTFERTKPFAAKKKDVVGDTTVIPMDDDDGKLKFYDIQGESLYTNPICQPSTTVLMKTKCGPSVFQGTISSLCSTSGHVA